ncbi:mobilization protein, partial [Enterobacter roggenkampii]
MIVKKVKNPQKAASKAVRVSRLTDYIREPERENSQEKCIHAGARGFITDEPQSQTAEMIALSQEAVRSKDTINHYVLSWREGEQPSPEQVEEAVSIFMDELGVKDHQAIYGLHADTDNLHLHLAINRVHPETLKVVKINNGFDIEAAHKAIARIENAQGWQREQNGRYQVLENGELGREHIDKDKPRQPAQPKRDMENRTGEKSAERIAIEDGAPIIKKAQTWEQLHRELAAKGMRYEKTGSGATLFVGDVGVKASSADRDASLSKLQKRLGAYQPPPQRQQVAQREPEPIKPDVPGWKDYITGRKAHYAEKNAAKLALDKRQEQERKQIAEQQKARRDELMRGNWKGKGEVLNAMRSVIAAEQAAEKAALKEKHQKQREQHRQQFRPYPDLEQWQRMQKSPELAEQWRHRASEPQRIEGASGEPPTPRDIRAYQPEIVGQQVHYSRKEEAGAGGGVSFVD